MIDVATWFLDWPTKTTGGLNVGSTRASAATGYRKSVDELARLLVGLLITTVAASAIAAAAFKVRKWRDWPHQWQSAHPAVSVILAMDLFTRALTRDRALPRSKRQALLSEAPTFLIAGVTLLVGVFLAVSAAAP
jgi:hypothetical protein